jgi:hypothetical protein
LPLSHPSNFIDTFITFNNNQYNRPGVEHPSICTWTKYTNNKAISCQAGAGGAIYRKFKPFSMVEIRQHLRLYIFNGLAPSPQVEMKFQAQTSNPVHGNDFIKSAFGPGAKRRHQHFKCFFAVQDPLVLPPARKKKPNWKFGPLIKWLNFIMPRARILGRIFSVDEQTIGESHARMRVAVFNVTRWHKMAGLTKSTLEMSQLQQSTYTWTFCLFVHASCGSSNVSSTSGMSVTWTITTSEPSSVKLAMSKTRCLLMA